MNIACKVNKKSQCLTALAQAEAVIFELLIGIFQRAEYIASFAAPQCGEYFAIVNIDIVPRLGVAPLGCAANLIGPQRECRQTLAITNASNFETSIFTEMIFRNMCGNYMPINAKTHALSAGNHQGDSQ